MTIKFAVLTTPGGDKVYVSESMIVSRSLTEDRNHGTLIRTQLGQQEVRELPADVVKILEELL